MSPPPMSAAPTNASGDEAARLREVWEGMGRVVEQRPHKDDHLLTELIKTLCTVRDSMIARHREEPLPAQERERLERLNAVLAQVFSLQFPLGPIPWDDFAVARGWLADLRPQEA